MKLLTVFLLSLLIVNFSLTPVLALAQVDDEGEDGQKEEEVVNSFDMFWPIVAGKTRGESLYFLKGFKEKLRGSLIFSSFKKAEYKVMLSDKRAVEAEKLLLTKKDFNNAQKTLSEAKRNREAAVLGYSKAKEGGMDTVGLHGKLASSFEKQEKLMKYVLSKVDNEGKVMVESDLKDISNLLSPLK